MPPIQPAALLAALQQAEVGALTGTVWRQVLVPTNVLRPTFLVLAGIVPALKRSLVRVAQPTTGYRFPPGPPTTLAEQRLELATDL